MKGRVFPILFLLFSLFSIKEIKNENNNTRLITKKSKNDYKNQVTNKDWDNLYNVTISSGMEALKGKRLSEDKHANNSYNKLQEAYAMYYQLSYAGGWDAINLSFNLSKGAHSKQVSEIKKRLALTNDFAGNIDNDYDQELENAVRNFQARHGLEETGVVNESTINEMNVPVEKRINQIEANLEEWDNVPTESSNYIMINIPEYRLHLIDNGQEIWSTEVIVGRADNATPAFNDVVESIVFSPSWGIPENIAYTELLPIIQQDISYLPRQGMEVYRGDQLVDPYTVNWNSISYEEFLQYSFRQKPWPTNPLGQVKFMLPNSHNVYLHDTPTKELFQRERREYSHGCIRLAHPEKLAEYLLRDDPAWTPENIYQAMNSGVEQYVQLKTQEPIYIGYFTTWVDEKGNVNFRDDAHGHELEAINNFEKAIAISND